MYQCEFFGIKELVPPDIHDQAHSDTILWMMFNRDVLFIADMLRDKYGRAYVNDWEWGGSNTLRGFRPFNTDVGSDFSQHKFANALDMIFPDADIYKIRQDIIDRKYKFMQKITGLELNIPWLHFDCRNYSELLTFTP